MVLPTPPSYATPIPNNPFYSPPSYALDSVIGPTIVGTGFTIDYTAGTINATGGGGGGGVTSVTAGAGLLGGTITTVGTISMPTTGVAAGTYTRANITVDAFGRITAAANGTAGTVTSVATGTGLTGGPITTSGTISLANTAVAAGSYTYASFTVDAQGRLTAANNGISPVTSVSVNSPIVRTGAATTPTIGIQTASAGQLGAVQVGTNISVSAGGVISVASATTAQSGIVQLNNTLTSTSTTEALTAAQGKILQDQIAGLSVTSNLTLAGTFDAAAGQMLTVTASGTAAGFTVGSNLPGAVAGNTDFFVIVTTPGSYSPPGGGGPYSAVQGDWFLSTGAAWEFLNVGSDLPIASTGTAGIVELATSAETQTGTSTALAVTPAGAAATYLPICNLTGKGALLSASAANTPATLAVGTDGQVLVACATATSGLCWQTIATGADIPCATLTAKGTLVGASAANTPATVPAATADGQVLVADSTTTTGVKWAASAAASSATPTVEGVVFGCTTGTTCNTSLGKDTLCALTTGCCNTAIGCCSLEGLTIGCRNVALGFDVANALQSGCSNIAIGYRALSSNVTGSENIAIGGSAAAKFTGSGIIAIGGDAGFCTSDANGGIFIGCLAGLATTSQACSIFIGEWAGSGFGATSVQTGNSNILIGGCAGNDISGNASCNTAMGACVICNIKAASNTVAIGALAMCELTTGSCNIAIGPLAGQNLTTGANNVLIGPGVCIPPPASSCQLAIGYSPTGYWLTGCSNGDIKPGAGILDCAGSVGTANQVLTSTGGSNRVCWQNVEDVFGTPTYSSVYSTATQTVTTVNTPQYVTFNTVAGSNQVANVGGEGFVIFGTGIYNLQFSIQLQTTTASLSNVEIWLERNGTAVPYTNTRFVTKGSGEASFAALNYVINNNSGGTWKLVWATDDANMTLFADSSDFGGPAIPSVIITVVPVVGGT